MTSARVALNLNPSNTDALFNTAQSINILAEALKEFMSTRTPSRDAGSAREAIGLLGEALKLLDKCFSLQQKLLQEQVGANSEPDGGVPLNADDQTPQPYQNMNNADDSEMTEQTATIQEPTTPMDLFDTLRLSLDALVVLIALQEPQDFSSTSAMASFLLDVQLPPILSQLSPSDRTEVDPAVALSRVEVTMALAKAEFLSRRITLADYSSRFQVYETLDLTTNYPNICTCADALMESATFITQSPDLSANADEATSTSTISWTQLSRAQTLYGRALQVNYADAKKADIWEHRGDVDMMRLRLLLRDDTHQTMAKLRHHAPQLVKNAETYYRQALGLFKADVFSSTQRAVQRLDTKVEVARLVQGLGHSGQGDKVVVVDAFWKQGQGRRVWVQDMEDEGILSKDWVDELGMLLAAKQS